MVSFSGVKLMVGVLLDGGVRIGKKDKIRKMYNSINYYFSRGCETESQK